MSNNEQLFTEIIPREESSLSGGGRRREPRQLEARADASGSVIGDAQRTHIRTRSRTNVTDRYIVAYAFSFVSVIL